MDHVNQAFDALTAVGTAGSFVTAVIIYWTSTRSARFDRRQAQAILVDAWIQSVNKDAGSHRVIYEVSNHSDQSVRQLFFELSTNNGPVGRPYVKEVIPPTVRGEFAKFTSESIPTPPAWEGMDPNLIRGLYRLTIQFTDAAGRRWKRDFQGRLTQVPQQK